jgi:phosphoribosyl 1,2-cyclic phosphate phosphodiesterase
VRVTVLGTGTSTGVPVPACDCAVCKSADKRNTRLRTSVYIEIQERDIQRESDNELQRNGEALLGAILIDTGPDFRYQSLRYGLKNIDAVLYTHAHADHIFGLDDLRCFNWVSKKEIPVYASPVTAIKLEKRFSYCFSLDRSYEGGSPPRLKLMPIDPYKPLGLFGLEIMPLTVFHGSMEVLAYRLGPFAYVTDCSLIPEETQKHLQGLEVMILDGLRYRPHPTHFTHAQAVAAVEKVSPKHTYLTHISHDVDHETANKQLRQATSLAVECAYDGLVIEL